MVSYVPSLHGGDIPKERDEQGRLLHDSEEPTSRPEPLQTGALPLHHEMFPLRAWSHLQGQQNFLDPYFRCSRNEVGTTLCVLGP